MIHIIRIAYPCSFRHDCAKAGSAWLSVGRNSSGGRGKHSAGQKEADGGNLSRYLDFVAGLVHQWARVLLECLRR
jgi:hypothetical protein